MSDAHTHLSDDVVALGDDVEVGDAVLPVEEGLPYHGRVEEDMLLYREEKPSLRLCAYSVGRNISHIAINRLSLVPYRPVC